MSRYHLYSRKTKQKNGREKKFWYYWYYAEDGSRIRHTTRCQSKRDAQDFIANLEKGEAALASEAQIAKDASPRAKLREIAGSMFIAGAAHLIRWEQMSRGQGDKTIEQHRRWIENYILPDFGERWIEEITGPQIEDWLIELKSRSPQDSRAGASLSNSTKNSIGRTFLLVLVEAKRAGLISAVPTIESFSRNSRKKDIIFAEEKKILFPDCSAALSLIWGRIPKNGRVREDQSIGLMFGTLFALAISTGLRPGEVRAIHEDQIAAESRGLFIDRAIDDSGTIGAPKKSRGDDLRFRSVLVPDRTWKMLDQWLRNRKRSIAYPDLVFTFRDKPISPFYLEDRFNIGLENAGILRDGRNLTPHSLRYTYDTSMRPVLPPDVLREFVGHRSAAMTEHYDRMNLRPALAARMLQLESYRTAVDTFW